MTIAKTPAHLTYHLQTKVITREGQERNGAGCNWHGAARDSARGRQREPGLEPAAREMRCRWASGSPWATATPGVPLWRLLLLLVLLLVLLLHPSLSQLSATAALSITTSARVRGGSKNNEHMKRANEKNNPLKTQEGAVHPFPRIKQQPPLLL